MPTVPNVFVKLEFNKRLSGEVKNNPNIKLYSKQNVRMDL